MRYEIENKMQVAYAWAFLYFLLLYAPPKIPSYNALLISIWAASLFIRVKCIGEVVV